MAFVCECDYCNTIYKHGFSGKYQKRIMMGKKDFTVVLDVRPQHLCKKCMVKFVNVLAKDLKNTYKEKEV